MAILKAKDVTAAKVRVIDIQKAFYRSTWQRYEMAAPNIHLDWKFKEMDILGLRKSGYVDEVEIKLSKADFRADFKKTVYGGETEIPREINGQKWMQKEPLWIPKHEALPQGLNHCNYFSFLLPKELADKCDIPEYAGLYIFRHNNIGEIVIDEVKRAPLLHKRKISERFKYEIGRKMAYRYWNLV